MTSLSPSRLALSTWGHLPAVLAWASIGDSDRLLQPGTVSNTKFERTWNQIHPKRHRTQRPHGLIGEVNALLASNLRGHT